MKFRRLHLTWLFPLILLALVIAAVWIADSWLESPGGNRLLQSELSKSLGFPVQLNGDYGLKLFPQLEIAGSGLVVLQKKDDQVLARSEAYSVAVDLRPLLNREIHISSVTLTDGFMDFRQLPSVEPKPLNDDQSLVLPTIVLLEMKNFRIQFSEGQSVLELEYLQLSNFQAGQPSEISIVASYVREMGEQPKIETSGLLTITPDVSVISFDIQEMQIDLGEFRAKGITGKWQWDQGVKELAGSMSGIWKNHQLDLTLQLLMEETPDELFSGHLQSNYRHPQLSGNSSLAIEFSMSAGVLRLELLEALVLDQTLAGTGCIKPTDPVQIDLTLKAGELDLDRIYNLIPVDAEKESGTGGIPDLPFIPAIVLHADKTFLAESVASDVQIEIGNAPECPETEVSP